MNAQEAPADTRRPLEPEDLCRLRWTGSVALHPSDESVVFSVTWPDATTDSNRSQLHVWDGSAAQQLTYGHADGTARFSPNGRSLAFVRSTPKQPNELCLLDWETRQLEAVATFDDGIDDVQWLDDGRLVLLASRRPDDQVGVDDDELARRIRTLTRIDYRFNGRGWIHDRPRQIAIVEPGRDEPLTWIDELVAEAGYDLRSIDHEAVTISPDGSALAVIAASDDDSDLTGANHVWIHHLDGTTKSIRSTEPGGWWEAVLWHPGGDLVTLGTTTADTHGFARPHTIDREARKATVVGPHDVNVAPVIGVAGGLVPVTNGLLLSGPRRGAVTIDHYDLDDGSLTIRAEGPYQAIAFDASPDGTRIVASVSSTDRPAELWQMSPGPPTRLVGLNDEILDEIELASVESVEVDSSDGVRVHAFVTRPPSSAPDLGSPGPGLVYVHGGPMAQFGYGFFDEFQLAAASGYTVIGGNPRGADGYGEAWATSIVGRLGTCDWDDVTAITDHLAAIPEVDPDRLAIGGGSYGGFMASWAVGHSNRYRAALVERAVTSWYSMFGTSDIGNPFGPALIGATIEDDLEAVARQSPLTYAAAMTTPMLILHSEEDWRCPIEQAEQLFTAVRRTGGDVTLVRVPGENHELTRSGSPKHRVERFAVVHEFFDHHLGVER